MKITALIENISNTELNAKHGLSLLLYRKERKNYPFQEVSMDEKYHEKF